MERFLWQSYPQHLQNTLFHAERIGPIRKKTLQERLAQAYEFKARGDERVDDKKWREAVTQYEFAYGLFKYCDKVGRKISMHDDTKAARELREEQESSGERAKDDHFTLFWLEVDEMMCSCLVMIAMCKMNYKNPLTEEALTAANEALEFSPKHVPALYRRSKIHLAQENYGDAVHDAKLACKFAVDDDLKFRMWQHRKHVYAERRANTIFWSMVGFTCDLPWTICGAPWTFAAMPPRKQALVVMLLALALGWVQLPPGTIRSLIGDNASIISENVTAAQDPTSGDMEGAPALGGAAALGAAAAANLDAAATVSATRQQKGNGNALLKGLGKVFGAGGDKATRAEEKAAKNAAKAAKNAAKAAAKEAARAAKAAAKVAKEEAKAKAVEPVKAPKVVVVGKAPAAQDSVHDEGELEISDVDSDGDDEGEW